MDQEPVSRVALMSIRPRFVAALLAGTKQIEFRKRRLADDIHAVVIYATAPISAVVGTFRIEGQVTASPSELWERYAAVGGIDREAFFDYFAGTDQAVGILVDTVTVYPEPKALGDVDPGGRPPQSFKYLDAVPA
jgi:predicted transcriptional regulator